jgi:hypothetical protein
MSDPEVPKDEPKSDVDDVVNSANAGLAEAEAARADVPRTPESDAVGSAAADRDRATADQEIVDPDLAAFEAAERDHPGVFAAPESTEATPRSFDSASADRAAEDRAAEDRAAEDRATEDRIAAERAEEAGAADTGRAAAIDDEFRFDRKSDATVADSAYAPSSADDAATRVMPSEPIVAETVVAPPLQQQPIFVQAPEPPRERGNRGTAGAIGLLATLAFAILYLAITLGWNALRGELDTGAIVDEILAPLTAWGFWVPVVVFFIGFWLLGAIINRGRWGLWVVFGLLVGVAAYGGYILGQLFEAPFWLISASDATDLVGDQLFAPLAIAAFVLGRELTIWFGAWVARSGARKTELNEEAQREYERTLEAGPQLSR